MDIRKKLEGKKFYISVSLSLAIAVLGYLNGVIGMKELLLAVFAFINAAFFKAGMNRTETAIRENTEITKTECRTMSPEEVRKIFDAAVESVIRGNQNQD